MSKQTTEAQIAVMQAYVRGEAIERRARHDASFWEQDIVPTWNWAQWSYRVQPAKPIEYRTYLWQAQGAKFPLPCCALRDRPPAENQPGFIRWIDAEWKQVTP